MNANFFIYKVRLTIVSTILTLQVLLLAVACNSEPIVPTLASVEQLQTAQFLTENSPPAGFQQAVSFTQIDAHLTALPAWHYQVSLTVDGKNTKTQEPAKGTITADVYSNQLNNERRVILQVQGDAFGALNARYVEGVRIVNDVYIVNQNQECKKATEPAEQQVADLTASSLIGGVKSAKHTFNRRTVNNLEAWEFSFAPSDIAPPALQIGDKGSATIASGILWITPSLGVVSDYQLTLNVVNASIQGSQPITGQVRIVYQLVESGSPFNISIPFGC